MQCSAQGFAFGKGSGQPGAAKRDASCYVDWSRAAEMSKSASSVVIDIRPKEAFTRVHLPGALNLSASEIKTKAYFAGKPLLIYGDGKADPRMDELCADLKGRGFRNVKILAGGVLAWAKTEEARQAQPAMDIRGLAELSASDLYAELHAGDSVIVSASSQFATPEIEARRLKMESGVSPEHLSAVLQKGNLKSAKSPVRRVVLIGVGKTDPKEILDTLSSSRIDWPVYYYAGDQQSYEAAMKRMNAQWSKHNKGPVAPKCGFS